MIPSTATHIMSKPSNFERKLAKKILHRDKMIIIAMRHHK